MDYIIRDKSVITGKKNLEHLYTFKDFPVFFGCVEQDEKKDLRADMSWCICPESGIIQLDKLIPLDILYQAQHLDGTGPSWKQYYKDFAEYIKEQDVKNILEIGGGMGQLAREFLDITDDTEWHIVEPNPICEETDRLKIIPAFFDENFRFDEQIDAIVHSQVLEHAYYPYEFLKDIATYLQDGDKLIFAYPHLEYFLKNKYTNAINFEHTIFLADHFTDYLLAKAGFRVTDKEYYKGYDIFCTAEKGVVSDIPPLENKYQEYKKIFLDFIKYHEDLIERLNEQIWNFDGEIYLFGGHVFSQYLIAFGLETSKITCILDNSKLKRNKRLYGTPLVVRNPEIIKGKKNVAVILKASIYQEEIRRQLLSLNPNCIIWE